MHFKSIIMSRAKPGRKKLPDDVAKKAITIYLRPQEIKKVGGSTDFGKASAAVKTKLIEKFEKMLAL